jgi:hypothetical protein
MAVVPKRIAFITPAAPVLNLEVDLAYSTCARRRCLAGSTQIAKCLQLSGPSDNIFNHHGRRTFTWSMKVKNNCGFNVKGRLTYANGKTSEIVFQSNTLSYETCSDDCKGASSVSPICGWVPNS